MTKSPYFGSGYFGSGYFGASGPETPGSLRATVSAAAIIVGTANGQAALFGAIVGSSAVEATASDGAGSGFIAASISAGAVLFATATFTGEQPQVGGGGGHFWISYRPPPLVPRFLWALRIKAGAATTAKVVGAVFAKASVRAGAGVSAQVSALAHAEGQLRASGSIGSEIVGAAVASASVVAGATATASGSANLVIDAGFQFDATEDELAMIFSLAA